MRIAINIFALCLALPVFATESRPNVVVLLADDLGWKDLRCYGGPVKTPTLDRLAGSGVRFTDFYSGAAVCSPSRATLLTGRHHVRMGIYSWISDNDQDVHLLNSEVTLAEILKEEGYETAHIGKWHIGAPFRGREKPWIDEHGFDYWFATDLNAAPSHRNPTNFWRNRERVGELEGYACQLVVDDAIRWLDEERDSKKPFFLNVWFHEPHAPIAAPDEIVADYGDTSDPAAIYSGTIDNTDRAIERLLEKLKAMGIEKDTLVIYSSDNGSYRRDRVGELRGAKGSNFEGGIRVPGIFSWPGKIPERQVVNYPAGQIDILPTVCGLLEIDPPEEVHLDGADLSPILLGKSEVIERDQPLAWILPLSGPSLALRQGNWSLIGYRAAEFPRDREAMADLRNQMMTVLQKNGSADPEAEVKANLHEGFDIQEAERLRGAYIRLNQFQETWIPAIKAMTYERFELYDLSQDRAQKQNVAAKHPKVFERLKKQLMEITRDVMNEGPDWSERQE
ncbi:MAG: sulfatase-like hydrolase/transferase [Verrucomicrobiales bacterium]